MNRFLTLLFILSIISFDSYSQEPDILFNDKNEGIRFAVEQLREALRSEGQTADQLSIELKGSDRLSPQAYLISFPAPGSILVEGGDDVGVMYGAIRLAELIRLPFGIHIPSQLC